MSWTIPNTLPVLGMNPLLSLLTVATVLAMFYALSIALDLYQLRRHERIIEEDRHEVNAAVTWREKLCSLILDEDDYPGYEETGLTEEEWRNNYGSD